MPRRYPSEHSEIIDDGDPFVDVVDNGADRWILDRDFLNGDGGGDSIFQSDFEHELELREAAQIGPQGQRLDELDAATQLAEFKRQERAELAKPVNVNPITAENAVLGGTARCQPGSPTSSPGPSQRVVFWAGDDHESRPVTVTVAPRVPLYGGTGTVRPVTKITWGTRDASHVVDLDCGTGIAITVCASNVYVDAYLDGGSDTAASIEAAIGFLATTNFNPGCRTIYFDSVGSGLTATMQRPSYGNRILAVYRGAGNPVDISLITIAGATVGAFSLALNENLSVPIYLPNDCVAVGVKNNAGGGGIFRIIFGVM